MATPEDYKFAYELTSELDCHECNHPFLPQDLRLEPVADNPTRFEDDYDCPDCGISYKVTIIEENQYFTLDAQRLDREPAHPEMATMHRSTHKASLQEEIHPARDLANGLRELLGTLSILYVNKERLDDKRNEIDQENGAKQPPEFHANVDADIHNYLSSSYSFGENLATIESNLPTDGPVAAEQERFNDRRVVIAGLRIYAQHHLPVPNSFKHYYDSKTNKPRTTIAINLNEVKSIGNTDKDGYDNGAPHHYSGVENDFIDLNREVDIHFRAATSLVNTIVEHVEGLHGSDLRNYARVTDLTNYLSNRE
jgi:hypothetical protein